MAGKNQGVPNQPKTPLRAVRVPDDLWQAAKEIAKERGDNLSEIMRDALVDYVRRYGGGRYGDF